MIKTSTHADLSATQRHVDPKTLRQAASLDLPPQQSLFRRIGKHPVLMHYNRLIALVVLVNLAFLGFAIMDSPAGISSVLNLSTLSNLVLAHFALAILIRQQYFINLLFWLATRAPTSWPLAIRRRLGKVYHLGGLHVGGAVVGTVWLAFFVRSLVFHVTNGLPGVSIGTVALTYALLLVLILMVIMALPPIRACYHNSFELTHSQIDAKCTVTVGFMFRSMQVFGPKMEVRAISGTLVTKIDEEDLRGMVAGKKPI
ncbi:MAG: hypothetical protein MI924_23985, partial [Chloroflexales bacterium]|nr:hypothetical protein [Chloroflexales bacterium]